MSDRPSLRHGLPYRWWASPGTWAGVLSLLLLVGTLTGLLAAWWFL